jgi:hypothetical protein
LKNNKRDVPIKIGRLKAPSSSSTREVIKSSTPATLSDGQRGESAEDSTANRYIQTLKMKVADFLSA